jgi:hypothetical protein
MTRPRAVFLSHAHADVAVARRIQSALRRDRVKFWFAPHKVVGSQRWHDEIGRALDRCDWFLLLLSPHAVSSKWVKHELLFALNADHYEDRIIPVLHRDCRFEKLSWTLDQIQRIRLPRRLRRRNRRPAQGLGAGPTRPARASTPASLRRRAKHNGATVEESNQRPIDVKTGAAASGPLEELLHRDGAETTGLEAVDDSPGDARHTLCWLAAVV